MFKILKQSTSVTVRVGPFVSSTDAVTKQTALTIAQADCSLSLNYAAAAQKHSATSGTHDTGGWYFIPFDTTDTGTVGQLQLDISKSGALPVRAEFTVVPASVYNALVAGTGVLNVNLSSINGINQAAANLGLSAFSMQIGTVTNAGFTPTTTEFECSDITTAAGSHWVGRTVIFTAGTLNQQAARITAYTLVTGRGHFTVSALTSAPANTDTLVIV